MEEEAQRVSEPLLQEESLADTPWTLKISARAVEGFLRAELAELLRHAGIAPDSIHAWPATISSQERRAKRTVDCTLPGGQTLVLYSGDWHAKPEPLSTIAEKAANTLRRHQAQDSPQTEHPIARDLAGEFSFTGDNAAELTQFLRNRLSEELTPRSSSTLKTLLAEHDIVSLQTRSARVQQCRQSELSDHYRVVVPQLPRWSPSIAAESEEELALIADLTSGKRFRDVLAEIEENLERAPRSAMLFLREHFGPLPDRVHLIPSLPERKDSPLEEAIPLYQDTRYSAKTETHTIPDYHEAPFRSSIDGAEQCMRQLQEWSADPWIRTVLLHSAARTPWNIRSYCFSPDPPKRLMHRLLETGEFPSNVTVSPNPPDQRQWYTLQEDDLLYSIDTATDDFGDQDVIELRHRILAMAMEHEHVHVHVRTAYAREDAMVVFSTFNAET